MPSATSWLEILLIALRGDLVRRRELRRHGPVRPRQGAVFAALSRAAGRRPEPRHLLAAVPAARSRRPSRPASPASSPPCRALVRGAVAVDGKTARRSFDRRRGQRPLHLISAWAVEQRLVLGQRKVDAASNETRALPELLALLTLDGRIVTADAMHGHKATAQAILDRGGEYCLALKANQPALLAEVRLLLDDPEARPAIASPPPTATTAASRPAGPRSCTMSPGWPQATGSQASRRSAR